MHFFTIFLPDGKKVVENKKKFRVKIFFVDVKKARLASLWVVQLARMRRVEPAQLNFG
jgi:hypothetical protein